jgi:hypothetical protein
VEDDLKTIIKQQANQAVAMALREVATSRARERLSARARARTWSESVS